MLHRHLTDALQAAAATSPVVMLTGSRESRKSALVRALFPDHRYLSLAAPLGQRERALATPRGFLAQRDHPANLDVAGVEARCAPLHPLGPGRAVGVAVR